MIQKMMALFRDHLKIQYDLDLYDYQAELAERIFDALIQNLRLTSNATPEDIKKLKQVEISAEISRQAGKTKAVGHIGEFICLFCPKMFNRPVRIGIFAAQVDQAKLSYSIMRTGLRTAKATMLNVTPEQAQFIKEEETARKLVLPDGTSATVAPINKISQIEGLTLDLIIIDEAQLADDEIIKHSIWPMGKTTNAPRIYIGKAGTRLCHFRTLGQQPGGYKVYFEEVAKQRRALYDKTGDAMHLIYEQSVREDINKYGLESDEIQREYFGKWQIGSGQFTIEEQIDNLISDRARRTYQEKESDCFAGIDTAKHPDSTVVTILRANTKEAIAKGARRKSIINWMELRGENYKDQFEYIMEFLSHYKVQAVAIDSTGQGDFMPDMFERDSNWQDENTGLYRLKFSAVTKDQIYKNLKVSISELLTDLPKLDTREAEKFKQQMLDLQQEWKGQLLSVHHPDDPNAHDDYPDSWALAEYAFAKWSESRISLEVVSALPEKGKHVDDGFNEAGWQSASGF